MNIDCHYYGTYYIAREAGWSDEEAKKIAWAAQTVDEVSFEVLKKNVYDNASDKEQIPRVITLLSLSEMAGNTACYTTAFRDYVMFSWMPFHFLPEKQTESQRLSEKDVPNLELNKVFYDRLNDTERSVYRKVKTYPEDFHLRCKTSTDLCKSMIKEALSIYEASTKDDKPCDDITLYRIGICMHVLADTWSHQGFCGIGDGPCRSSIRG